MTYYYRLKRDTKTFERFKTTKKEQKRWLKLVPEFTRIVGIQLEENMQIMVSDKLCITGLDKVKFGADLNQDGRTFKSRSKQQRAYTNWLKENEFDPKNFSYPSHFKLGIWAFGWSRSHVVFHEDECYYYIETESNSHEFDEKLLIPVERAEYNRALEAEETRKKEVA